MAAQPPGHRRPRDSSRRLAPRRRARLPHGHRARRHAHVARAHRSVPLTEHAADREIEL